MKLNAITTVVASTAFGISAINAAISIDGTTSFNSTSGTFSSAFDVGTADKLVVFVTGEHGFNNTSGQANDITYNGISLTRLVDRNPVASGTDTLYGDIWYIDNPTPGSNTLEANTTTRGNVTAFALSGTAAGVGDSGFSGSNTRTIDLTTQAGSLTLAAFNIGGAGNTAGLGGISPDGPNLTTQHSALENGNNLDGHVTASGSP